MPCDEISRWRRKSSSEDPDDKNKAQRKRWPLTIATTTTTKQRSRRQRKYDRYTNNEGTITTTTKIRSRRRYIDDDRDETIVDFRVKVKTTPRRAMLGLQKNKKQQSAI
jgi:hypothetical protein